MTIEKTEREKENNNSNSARQHRDFGRHDIYMPKNINNIYAANTSRVYTGSYNTDNKFRFKNSLIMTPNYEIEFNGTGGVKYIKNHDNCTFFTGGNIFFRTNGIQKMPVLLKREINKLSDQKKLIVEEKYNYEEKYETHQNIILYYEENRLDFQILFKKSDPQNNLLYQNKKDITTEFSLNLAVPGIEDAVTYKKFAETQEYKNFISKLSHPNLSEYKNSKEFINSPETVDLHEFDRDLPILDNLEYIIIKCGKSEDFCMTIYPDKKQILKYNNKSLGFAAPNLNQDNSYINLKIYLEKYKFV